MNVVVRECGVAELWACPDFPDVLNAYARESHMRGMPEPQAHQGTYLMLEAAGMLSAFGAFEGDQLVGLSVLLVSLVPHYGVRMGHVESYFVLPGHRKNGAGVLLRRALEDKATAQDAHGIFFSAPVASRLAEVLSKDVRYGETNRVFMRVLK